MMRFVYGTMFLLASSTMFACGSFVKMDICLSDPAAGGMQCALKDDTQKFKSFSETENYVCTTPEDYRTLVETIKRRCQ